MFNALGWVRRLEILTAYKVGSRKIRLLQTYWGQLTMVVRSGRYFGL